MKYLEHLIFFLILFLIISGCIYFYHLDNIKGEPITVIKTIDTIFVMNATCYIVKNEKSCNNKTACLKFINKINPLSNRIVALPREMIKKYNKNAYFSYGDSVLLSGKNFIYAGKYIIADCTAKSIHNSIDICIGKNDKIGSWKGIFIQKIKN